MSIAERLEGLNRKASQKVLRIKKGRDKQIEEDIKGLWKPFLFELGRLVCLPVLVATAVMAGIYAGIQRTVKVLHEEM